MSRVKLICFSFFDIQVQVKLVCFSFFAFRYSFFDIRTGAEFRVLTFKIGEPTSRVSLKHPTDGALMMTPEPWKS